MKTEKRAQHTPWIEPVCGCEAGLLAKGPGEHFGIRYCSNHAAAPDQNRVLKRIAQLAHACGTISLSALMDDSDETIGQALYAAIAKAEGNR